jgi:hypothetical protein
MRTLVWLIAVFVCACTHHSSRSTDGGASCCDLATNADLAPAANGADLATADGPQPCSSDVSPSGYGCDPWSVHTYVMTGAQRTGQALRLSLMHDPDYEGSINDINVPSEHQYLQYLTVDVPYGSSAQQFLCIVFANATPPDQYPIDSSLTTSVDYQSFTLLNVLSPDGQPHVANVLDLCGGSLPAVISPRITGLSKATMPDVALMIPLAPSPRAFTVGTTFKAWLGRGVMYRDEDKELVPVAEATVVTVQ